MIDQNILDSLRQYTASMQRSVTLVLQSGEHSKRAELLTFLEQIASVSDHISVVQEDATQLRSPISFRLDVEGKDTGIQFSGIPSGHEFNSLVLAILRASGTPLKLDQSLQDMISSIEEPMHFEVFVSLSCHNCPEVVQSLNQFALLNDRISAEMIDGGLYQDLVAERDIQGVPSVYLNGELFANGKVDTAELIDKLLASKPAATSQPDSQTQTKAAPTKQLPLQDVVVIGGGPAGVGSAIYSARKGLKVTIIADRFGGQVKDTMGIENLIGVPSTTGTKLTNDMQAHLKDYDVTLKEYLRVTEIVQGDIKTVTLSSGEVIRAKTLIIATGAKWRELGVPGEKENIGNGVAYCPHCDGPFFKGKDVAVIGGGNSGIEAALDLAGLVKSVTVFEFMPELKAEAVLVKQAEQRNNIKILKNVTTKQIVATDGKVSAIEYQDRATDEVTQLPLHGVFVQIGLLPNSKFLGDVVELSQHGEVKINERCQTSAKGIYAAGDVTTVPYKQIVISMGEGAKASLAAFEYLLTLDVKDEEDVKEAA